MARRNVFQSSNPVFNRAEGFKPGSTGGYAAYGSPSSWSTGAGTATQAPYSGGQTGYGTPPTHDAGQGRMTLDSVVQKTALSLAVVVVAGALTWFLTPALDTEAAGIIVPIAIVSAIVGFGLAMLTSFKKVISPALVLAYAAVEGIFIGAISKYYNAAFGDGIVTGAVIGTVAALAGTLAAYKIFGIKVGDRFRKGVVAAGFGLVGLMLLDLVLGLFNNAIGFNGMGPLGLVMSVAILIFGIFSLIMDFDFVERGIAAQLPERESWRAAFGLTVSLVMIYVNLLRLLAILRGD